VLTTCRRNSGEMWVWDDEKWMSEMTATLAPACMHTTTPRRAGHVTTSTPLCGGSQRGPYQLGRQTCHGHGVPRDRQLRWEPWRAGGAHELEVPGGPHEEPHEKSTPHERSAAQAPEATAMARAQPRHAGIVRNQAAR